MPTYDIRVQINLEADDMQFDSEADAEAYGWKMGLDMMVQHFSSVEDIEVTEQYEEEE